MAAPRFWRSSDAPVASNGPFYERSANSTPTRIPATLVARAHALVSRIHTALGSGVSVLHTEMRTFENDLLLLEFGVRIGVVALPFGMATPQATISSRS